MKPSFEVDPFPGRPKILFIAFAQGSHTQSWIDLLKGTEFNIRLFGLRMPYGLPPKEEWVKTYETTDHQNAPDSIMRRSIFSSGRRVRSWIRLGRLLRMLGLRPYLENAFIRQRWPFHPARKWHPSVFFALDEKKPEDFWLAHVIRIWQPDIIHTMGLDPAGNFYHRVRSRFGLSGIGKWVLQLRGGSDLALNRLNPELSADISTVLRDCDQLVSDNELNFKYVAELGLSEGKKSSLGIVPGSGGVDVDGLYQSWQGPPSERRIIIWPKAYDSPWSIALPVFEALKMAWDQIEPCEIYMLAMTVPGTRMWYWSLPERIRRSCRVMDRIPRQELMQLLVRARILLAPSLVDGIPNSMLEAMAAGAFPIVSPLETIAHVVANENNVLFARNLFPGEIAGALARAMADDSLVDQAARRNLELVRKIADRSKIGPRVINYYKTLVGSD